MAPTKEHTPPDGGWGWMVAVGMALIFITTTGHYAAFGLLFEDLLDELDISTTGATIIMNALTGAVNFTGLVTNYLLRTMSFRLVSIIGGILFSLGLMLTVVADSIIQIVITYSIIAGVGLGLLAPSSYLALNSYFSDKLGVAMGICQAAIGLGYMVASPFCQYLLEQYSFRGTMLLLGGISLNSLVGAMLFQPVQKHLKRIEVLPLPTDEMEDVSLGNSASNNSCVDTRHAHKEDDFLCMAVIPEEEDELTSDVSTNVIVNKTSNKTQSSSQDTECDEHIVITRRGSLVMSAMLDYQILTVEEEGHNSSKYNSTTGIIREQENRRPISASLTNFSSNLLMFDNSITVADTSQIDDNAFGQRKKRPIIRCLDLETARSLLMQLPDEDSDDTHQSDQTEYVKKKAICHRVARTISQFLDLNLLRDVVFVNIVLGLSLSFVSDSNFFIVLPFFLKTKGFSGSEIALCLSVTAGADIVARLVLPALASLCKITPRTMYLLACLTSAIVRSVFISMAGDFIFVAVMSGVIGFLKGGMVVNVSLAIAQHVNLAQFGAAYSIYMVITGIVTLFVGSFIGMLSFPFAFHIMSMGLLFCSVTWFCEYMILEGSQRVSLSRVIKRVFCK